MILAERWREMQQLIKLFSSKQFVLFLLTGGFAAAVNFGCSIIYNHWLSFSWAVIFAYLTGMLTAYTLAKMFVFKASTQSTRNSVLYFVLVNMVAIVQTWLISMGLAYYLLPLMHIENFKNEIAHGIGVMIPVFTSYIGHKYLSFKGN